MKSREVLDFTRFFMTENPALRQHLSHPRKTTPSSDENCITLLTRKASGYLDTLYSVNTAGAVFTDRVQSPLHQFRIYVIISPDKG